MKRVEQEAAEARRREEEERLREVENELKRRLEEERARLAEEKARLEEEAKSKLAEEKRRIDEQRKKEQYELLEARRQAEELADARSRKNTKGNSPKSRKNWPVSSGGFRAGTHEDRGGSLPESGRREAAPHCGGGAGGGAGKDPPRR